MSAYIERKTGKRGKMKIEGGSKNKRVRSKIVDFEDNLNLLGVLAGRKTKRSTFKKFLFNCLSVFLILGVCVDGFKINSRSDYSP